jgi:CRP-like cAMP-binding protein
MPIPPALKAVIESFARSRCSELGRMPNNHNSNVLLAALNDEDRRRLEPYLTPFNFASRALLFEAGSAILAVYFPFNAVISLVVVMDNGEAVEAAMLGRDGIIGASAALDGKVSLSRAIVQIPGSGLSCELDAFKSVAMQSPAMISLFIKHEQTLYAQAQQTAACNVKHHVDARLARWLLRAHDLSGSDTLQFTQEFLGEMLGVERASVAIPANTFQSAGIIKYSRGKIQILNLEAPQDSACECYAAVKMHYSNLMNLN